DRGADAEGVRGAEADGPRSLERRDRAKLGRQRDDGEDACRARADEDGPSRSRPGGRDGVRVRPRAAWPSRFGARSGLILRRAAPLRGLRRTDSLPALAALAALTAGIFNLVSAATPNSGWRHRFLLRNVESLDEIRVFHAIALPAAAALIVTAFYLYRRRRGALNVAVALLLALGVLNLAKGLDFEEALWSFAAAGLLWWGRAAFHVRHDPVSL